MVCLPCLTRWSEVRSARNTESVSRQSVNQLSKTTTQSYGVARRMAARDAHHSDISCKFIGCSYQGCALHFFYLYHSTTSSNAHTVLAQVQYLLLKFTEFLWSFPVILQSAPQSSALKPAALPRTSCLAFRHAFGVTSARRLTQANCTFCETQQQVEQQFLAPEAATGSC